MSSPLVLVSQSDEILSAIKEFTRFLQIPVDIVIHASLKDYLKQTSLQAVEAPHVFYLPSDQQSTSLIECLNLFRSYPNASYLPIVVISETGDPNILGMIRDYDFLSIHTGFSSNSGLVSLLIWSINFSSDCADLIHTSRMIDSCFAQSNFEEALRLIKQRKALSSDRFRCFYLEARALLGLKRHEEARASIHLALEDNPGSILVRELLFKIFEELDDYGGIEALLKQSFDRGQRDISLHLRNGDFSITKQKYDVARASYLAALALNGNELRAHEGLAILDMLGNVSGALKNKQISPVDLARSANQKALELTKLRMFKQAEAIYLNVLKLPITEEVSFKVYMNLALCMKRAQLYEKALGYLEMCLKLDSKNEKATQQMAQIKSKIADKSKKPARAG